MSLSIYERVPLPPPQRERLARDVAALEPPARSVLVIRSRIGRTARAVARACPNAEIVGVDPSEKRIERARRASDHPGQVHYVRGELEALPWESGRFDVAVVMLGLHEMPDDERARVMGEGYRVLAPTGRFFALEPDRPRKPALGFLADLWFRYMEEEWAGRLLSGGLARELAAHGFTIEREEALGAGFFQLVRARKDNRLGP